MGPQTVWVLTDREAMHEVFLHADVYQRSRIAIRQAGRFLGLGVPLLNGERHRLHRKLVLPGFKRERLGGYAATMVAHTRRQVDEWIAAAAGGEVEIDAAHAMTRLSLAIATSTLFSVDTWDNEEVGRAMRVYAEALIEHTRRPIHAPRWVPTPSNRRAARAIADADRLVWSLIRSRREDPGECDDLLGMLIAATDEESGAVLTDVEVRDEAMSLMFAGHETTANTLAWALAMLTLHPDVEAAVRAEIATVVGDRAPGMADLPKLSLLERVVKETLRLYPATWVLDRETTEEVELLGTRLPRRSMLLLSPFVMMRDPDVWPDPERWDPDRFLPDREQPEHGWAPFGGGMRLCLGWRFAMMEAQLVLATILPAVRLVTDPDWTPVLAPLATLGIAEFPVRLSARRG
jgi:cytochrome P450